MTNTNNLSIPLIAQNQAQKEVTANEAFCIIDAILNRGAVHKGTNTPPGSPVAGDLYIIGSSPTGSWSGQGGHIAYYNGTWKFIVPNEGFTVWVNDENMEYSWDGAAWVSTISGAMQNLPGVGVNASYDSTNKLAVKSDAVLLDNNGSDSRVKVNKNASGNTASHLFQNGYSGRAEFGLIGDDNFQVKVSPDGSAWYQAWVVDKSTGNSNLGDKQLIRPELKDYAETLTIANSGTAYTIDLELGNVFEITLTGNCTFTFSNPPASGKAGKFTLIRKQDATGSRTVTWPAAAKWAGGVAPTLTSSANSVDVISFRTTDGGAKWYGHVEGLDVK